MREHVFLVDYATRVGFTIPVIAETADRAQDLADKLIDTGAFVPSEKVAYQLSKSWNYSEPPEVTKTSFEAASEEYGEIYSASNLEVNND